MNPRILFASLLLWAACITGASAQLIVSVKLPRAIFLTDEPLKATLSITNQAGREIVLQDTPQDGPWCLFQIKAVRGDYIPSRKPGLTFPPVTIAAGETINRSVDIAELYSINEPGQYRIRACINFVPTHSQHWSEPVMATTDAGRLLWNQTVGVPDGRPGAGEYRSFSLMTLQRPDGIYLFAKLEGKQEGIRYGTYPLGRVLAAMQPQTQLDPDNNLYVFHATSDLSYTLSQIDVATGSMGQALYKSANQNRQGRPSMRKNPMGQLVINGGIRVTEEEMESQAAPAKAKLSDRPPGF